MLAGSASGWLIVLHLASAVGELVFEVYAKPDCAICMAWMHGAFAPLVEAGFSGDEVKLVVVPWPGEGSEYLVNDDGIFEGGDTDTAVQVCALRKALSQPVSIDSPEIVSAVKFIACDGSHNAMGAGLERVKGCALEAGMEYDAQDGVKVCEDPQLGLELMQQGEYSKLILGMKNRSYSDPPHVYLNGSVLNCQNWSYCYSMGGESGAGAMQLPTPGTLTQIACSLVDTKPPACDKLEAPAKEVEATVPPTTTYCENCRLRRWEVLPAQRTADNHAQQRLLQPLPFAGLAAAALLGAMAIRYFHQSWRQPTQDGTSLLAE